MKPNLFEGILREILPREYSNKRIDMTKQSKNARNKNNVAIENQDGEVNSNLNSTTTSVCASPGNPPCHQTAKGFIGRKIIAKKLIMIAIELK